MKLPRRKFLYLAASAVPLFSISRAARAQTYPARPVRVIVPYAPGGPTDVFSRLMAQKLSEQLGKQFYVENIGGGGGNVGMGQGARRHPTATLYLLSRPPSSSTRLYMTKSPSTPTRTSTR
jgi:tripartite-type tricarboxylate transporter receptor subunit TctC